MEKNNFKNVMKKGSTEREREKKNLIKNVYVDFRPLRLPKRTFVLASFYILNLGQPTIAPKCVSSMVNKRQMPKSHKI